ncbi:carbon-nitrogen hydrolase family protein [Nocardioides cavernaquae]|uniref:Carbon-nitrogen hydrolase n=1 Tax=Nocardioides cavernaquae TaxID=2321396 RepID=A0A3A5HAZ7_9ACTN|nr:carbon-nitrogen hydrolase family protein [Nocardioides cavernaquae]RJS47793.1 carbon-nitrogen hydrolase [Nocardioides cavernaquae]
MRIAVWQTGSADLGQLRSRALEAAAAGARLLVVPEAFTSGYAVPGIADLAQPADGPWAQEIAAIAAEAGLAILYGFPERDGDRVFNSAQLIDGGLIAGQLTESSAQPTGEDSHLRTQLAKHRKCHLYGDVDLASYSPGDGFTALAELDGVRVGIAICYDVEFPEAVRTLALAGADLVAVPTALMRPYEVVARTIVPARAYENQVYVAYANRSGAEGTLLYCGESCVVGPDGSDLARAGSGDELLLAEIDPARLAMSRADNTHLSDRRPALYRSLIEERPVAEAVTEKETAR